MPPGEVSLADVVAELKAIREASERAAGPPPLLLTADQAAALLGISRAGLFRSRAAGQLVAVDAPGGGVRYRRSDVESLAAKLKPTRRRTRRPAPASAVSPSSEHTVSQ
ncbi:MAG: helix-turn-helix domain-containing protein [Gemmataceae bacterium]